MYYPQGSPLRLGWILVGVSSVSNYKTVKYGFSTLTEVGGGKPYIHLVRKEGLRQNENRGGQRLLQ